MGEKGSKTLINYNFSGSLLDYFYGTVVPPPGRNKVNLPRWGKWHEVPMGNSLFEQTIAPHPNPPPLGRNR